MSQQTFILPSELRTALAEYIQSNPSPNVPVGNCLQLVMALQNLKPVVNGPSLVEDGGEEFATPGAKDTEEKAE